MIAAFNTTALPEILAEIAGGPQPPIADWYLGTYGIEPADARKIKAKGCRYAPVFGVQPSTSAGFRAGRKLPAADEDPSVRRRHPQGTRRRAAKAPRPA